jgi:glycosyltransferase involved in cell wall biosynthesis
MSVVVAAHDEASVLGPSLDALLAQEVPHLDVTVVANGCTDATADVARSRGVRVLELEQPGKAGALNGGDAAAQGFPRVFLDADIRLPPGALAAFAAALDGPGAPLVVAPARRLEVAGRPVLVRAHSAVSRRLPAYRDGLFGRGVVAVSAEGRRRFDAFPALVADDLFLDGVFTADERRILPAVEVVVQAPLRTGDLLRRLVRVRRANAAMRTAGRDGSVPVRVRDADRWAWLRSVVLPRPWLLPAGLVYGALTAVAAALARQTPPAGARWARDDSTRTAAATTGHRPT